ncbi:MAG: GNAT family N-acetyltransferase [Mycobacteriaceae bacterium]|nr:GNAT family N-acetyltransferase [Mycobacteriaceae bacterium]
MISGQPDSTSESPLRGQQVVLRRATLSDAPAFRRALATTEVARWWDGWPDPGDALAMPDHKIWAITVTGNVVGLIKWYERCASIIRFASIDMFIHPDYHRCSYGSDALRALIKWLFTDAGHHRITVDPARDNTAAIRCAEHLGFQQVGVLRQYERTPQGNFRDGLLMDLLASDFLGCT